jgi:hypothetical protein
MTEDEIFVQATRSRRKGGPYIIFKQVIRRGTWATTTMQKMI